MAEWIDLIGADELAPGKCKNIEVAGKYYAVYNVEGTYYCTDDECIHQGGPLGEGYLSGKCVSCPWHGWEFDVTTGECEDMPGEKLGTYATRLEGGKVQISIGT